jgi:hypothetical protein
VKLAVTHPVKTLPGVTERDWDTPEQSTKVNVSLVPPTASLLLKYQRLQDAGAGILVAVKLNEQSTGGINGIVKVSSNIGPNNCKLHSPLVVL